MVADLPPLLGTYYYLLPVTDLSITPKFKMHLRLLDRVSPVEGRNIGAPQASSLTNLLPLTGKKLHL